MVGGVSYVPTLRVPNVGTLSFCVCVACERPVCCLSYGALLAFASIAIDRASSRGHISGIEP